MDNTRTDDSHASRYKMKCPHGKPLQKEHGFRGTMPPLKLTAAERVRRLRALGFKQTHVNPEGDQ